MSTLSKIRDYAFKGLNPSYYFRHFVLIGWLPLLISYLMVFGDGAEEVATANRVLVPLFMLVFWLLYPYARFVYDSVVGFIMGDNVFFVNAILALAWKLISSVFLFCFSYIIAPLGLIYLYLHFSKIEKQQIAEAQAQDQNLHTASGQQD